MLVKIRKDKSLVTTKSNFFTLPFHPLVKYKARRFHYKGQLIKPLSSTAIKCYKAPRQSMSCWGYTIFKNVFFFLNTLLVNFPNQDLASTSKHLFPYSTQ